MRSIPVTSLSKATSASVAASVPERYAARLRKKSRFAFARAESCPLRTKPSSPTATILVGLSERSRPAAAPRSAAAATQDSPTLASAMNSSESAAPPPAAADGVKATGFSKTRREPSSGEVAGCVVERSPTTTSLPVSVFAEAYDATAPGRSPHAERSDEIPAKSVRGTMAKSRPPWRR